MDVLYIDTFSQKEKLLFKKIMNVRINHLNLTHAMTTKYNLINKSSSSKIRGQYEKRK